MDILLFQRILKRVICNISIALKMLCTWLKMGLYKEWKPKLTTESGTETTETGNDRVIFRINLNFWLFDNVN